jgi:hypothetical protein
MACFAVLPTEAESDRRENCRCENKKLLSHSREKKSPLFIFCKQGSMVKESKSLSPPLLSLHGSMIFTSRISWLLSAGRAFARGRTAPVSGGLFVLLVFLLLGAASPEARAQRVDAERSRYGRAAVYHYADSDDVTIRVNVWGAVQNAGVYEVPRDARLNLLLSAAGGPQIDVRQREDDQTVILELVREGEDGARQVVYEQTMNDQVTTVEENVPLQDGDVLTVNSYVTEGVNWRDVLNIGSSLITLGITIINFATS